jgi:PhoPQ-activated pathogenicity-related protein
VNSRRVGSAEVTELILTSQTWRDTPWKHQLVLIRPQNLDTSSGQVFLFIGGGRWKPEHENGYQGDLPRSAQIFVNLAETMRAPIAVLGQVPFQPMYDRREDALIAYTFDHYLLSGEADWPLLLPMVKTAVRAMDAIQEFTAERWQMPVASFTVAGASKRGWTSWLTAAVEPRVSGVAPIAIDMLNLRHRSRCNGKLSAACPAKCRIMSPSTCPDASTLSAAAACWRWSTLTSTSPISRRRS